MPFESLEPELAAHLSAICKAQMSGQYDPRMVFQPGKNRMAKAYQVRQLLKAVDDG